MLASTTMNPTRPSWAVHPSQPPKSKTTLAFWPPSSPKARIIIKLVILSGRISQSTKMGWCWCVASRFFCPVLWCFWQLLDIGVIDVNTCQPLPNVLVDIWQANATGHYAGVFLSLHYPCPLLICCIGHPWPKPEHVDAKPQVGGKRNGLLPPFPLTVQEETWLRGAWPTDENGVAQFTSTCRPHSWFRLTLNYEYSDLPGLLHWTSDTHPYQSVPGMDATWEWHLQWEATCPCRSILLRGRDESCSWQGNVLSLVPWCLAASAREPAPSFPPLLQTVSLFPIDAPLYGKSYQTHSRTNT